VAVLFISHDMQHVIRVADRVVVLRLGRKSFDGARTRLADWQLVGLMTGPLAEDAPSPIS
jgi:ABC-type sugar transport system ATPase subunit